MIQCYYTNDFITISYSGLNGETERHRLIIDLILSLQRSKVYLAARDTLPGSYRFETLCEVMRQSRKIIIVMSNSFLNSSECMAEAAFAGEAADKVT